MVFLSPLYASYIDVHLLATYMYCIVTTNVIIMPYIIVYMDNKLVTATMHGCNYNLYEK